ncbi:MAG TPA: lipopolysaccharide kinase InaA family protein [Gemmataceae bacterium]|nr:lipopolysaccharide kinase InaA family protein [Gemmataceae bacterium]
MGFLIANPNYRELLERHGLDSAERLASLPGLIVTGHPGRNVARVAVGGLTAYLKREHRVLWRDRLLSAVAGFGFASLAGREAQTLAALRTAGVACPECMAAGEDKQGRAFLLLAALPDAVDLRQFLRDRRGLPPGQRYRFARNLGAALSVIHEAGFDHPDLYAKHVLVAAATERCYFLDWQRSRRRRRVGWRERVRDLAALDATLAEEFATGRERLACLRGYLGASTALGVTAKRAAFDIRRAAERLLGRRHIRKERATPPPVAGQGILWLDGEALCVTQAFWREVGGAVPPWLPLPAAARGTSRSEVALPRGRRGLLVRRWCDRPLAWLWCAFRRRPLLSPELRDAGDLFRRQKHGLAAPRVLAFGQRRPRPWRTESFLLTEIDGPDEGRPR